MKTLFILLIIIPLLIVQASTRPDARIKDLTTVGGSYSVNLVGYGIVTGLNGTGDGTKSAFTVQSVANMLENYGVKVNKRDLKPKNTAAVMVTTNLPSHGKVGTKLDVTVSSLGDAKSLQGGNLMITPLTDPLVSGNSAVYATASGNISIGGFNAAGGGGAAAVRKNYTLVGRIPEGAVIEKGMKEKLVIDGAISLYLNEPDFTTSVRIAKTINNFMGEQLAQSVDKAEVKVNLPLKYQNNSKAMEFIALLEAVRVEPDGIAKVVVNERTGTIVIGEEVRLNPVAISHGNLSIKITDSEEVVQPDPFTMGETATNKKTDAEIEEEKARVIESDGTTTLKELVDALNKLGVTPRDMISIFQALKQAGALHAELVLI